MTRASPISDVHLNDARDVESDGVNQKARGLGPLLGVGRGGWRRRAGRGGLGVPTKRGSDSTCPTGRSGWRRSSRRVRKRLARRVEPSCGDPTRWRNRAAADRRRWNPAVPVRGHRVRSRSILCVDVRRASRRPSRLPRDRHRAALLEQRERGAWSARAKRVWPGNARVASMAEPRRRLRQGNEESVVHARRRRRLDPLAPHPEHGARRRPAGQQCIRQRGMDLASQHRGRRRTHHGLQRLVRRRDERRRLPSRLLLLGPLTGISDLSRLRARLRTERCQAFVGGPSLREGIFISSVAAKRWPRARRSSSGRQNLPCLMSPRPLLERLRRTPSEGSRGRAGSGTGLP